LKVKKTFPAFKNALVYYKAGVVVINLKVIGLAPGANPTIASYNGSAFHTFNFDQKKYF
jgi:hypothetical protein